MDQSVDQSVQSVIYFSRFVFTKAASVIITDHPWWMVSLPCLLANGCPFESHRAGRALLAI